MRHLAGPGIVDRFTLFATRVPIELHCAWARSHAPKAPPKSELSLDPNRATVTPLQLSFHVGARGHAAFVRRGDLSRVSP